MQKLLVLIAVYLAMEPKVEGSADTMKKIMLNYAKAIGECKKEMDLPDSIDEDFKNFWKPDYVVTNRFTGCAIMCLTTKLELVSPDGTLHHGNAQEFAQKHGADEAMAKKLIEILHGCQKAVTFNEDGCLMVLDVAKCFKEEILKLNWAPDLELAMAEVLSEA